MSPPNRPPSTATPAASASASTDRSRTDRSGIDPRLSRRAFIAAGSTTALVSLAGCSAVVDFLADLALRDVNVFNGADDPVSGSIEIVDPDGETVLEEPFDLEEAPEDDESDEDNESTAFYDDVWTDAGDYEVTVALDEPIGDDEDDEESDENAQNESTDPDSDSDAQNESVGPDEDGAELPANDSSGDPAADGDADAEPSNDSATEEDSTDEESPNGPSNTDTVTIDDTDEQKLVVGIAQDGPAELISYHVIEDFSDLEDEFEE